MKKLILVLLSIILLAACSSSNYLEKYGKRADFKPLSEIKKINLVGTEAYYFKIKEGVNQLPIAFIKVNDSYTYVSKDIFGNLKVSSPKTYVPTKAKESSGLNLKKIELFNIFLYPERINSKEDLEKYFPIIEVEGVDYFVLKNIFPSEKNGWMYLVPIKNSSIGFLDGKIYFENNYGIYLLTTCDEIPILQDNFLNQRKIQERKFKESIVQRKKDNIYPKKTFDSLSRYHCVKVGDTIYNISRKYSISQNKLLFLNPHIDKRDFKIRIGELLRVK